MVQVVLELDRGGLETMCADLAVELASRGIRSVVMGLDRGGGLEGRLAAHNVEFLSMGGRRLRDPRFHLRVARTLRALRPAVVHTHSFGPLVYAVPSRLTGHVPRLVNTEHSIEYLLDRPGFRRSLRAMSGVIDSFVVLGERMRRFYASEIGVSRDRLRVIPNGVAPLDPSTPAYRADIRTELRLGSGFLVISVGRLAPEKNFAMLIDAFSRVAGIAGDAALVFVGDGPERSALEERAKAKGIGDRVTFLGWRQDVARILPAFDVFALSSISEGLPMAMLEAMSASLPVVSTAVGDIPEVVTSGETGLLVPPGNTDALADALLSLHQSKDLSDRMRHAGRELVLERYSRKAMVDAYIEAYALPTSAPAAT